MTRRARLDRIASATRNVRLESEVLLANEIVCREGYVLAVRVLADKAVYNQVEDCSGRFIRLRAGDVLAGVLGARRALRGYAGEVPASLSPGETINVLNLGGVLGRCTTANLDLGPPFDVEVLGAVLAFPRTGDRLGRPAHIGEGAVAPASRLACELPVVYVAGTCMEAGKTMAATEVVRGLARAGRRVAGVKLTGVSLRRDTLAMLDAGAVAALTFTDAGIVSTDDEHALPTAYGLLNELARSVHPDVVVAELGDGILGEYGVASLLADRPLMALSAALVVCAPDQVAAWGVVRLLEERFALRPTVISGPVTDNEVGCRFVRTTLGCAAANARRGDGILAATVMEALDAHV
ncbi:MAG: hypothetical protein V1750_04015 [Acidobacteriota bacterium]